MSTIPPPPVGKYEQEQLAQDLDYQPTSIIIHLHIDYRPIFYGDLHHCTENLH